MASLRTRITYAHGLVMAATLVILAIILDQERKAAATRDLVGRATTNAQFITRVLQRQGVQGVTVDTSMAVGSMLNRQLTQLFDVLPAYIVIGDSTRALYGSAPVRKFAENAGNDQLTREQRDASKKDLDDLLAAAFSIRSRGGQRLASLSSDDVLLVGERADPPLPGGVTRVVVGYSTTRIDEASTEVLQMMLVLSPIVLIVAMSLAWALSGRLLAPMGRMMSEVGAITDGRSLHRRIVLGSETPDEIAGLGDTLNAMIGRLEASFAALRRFTADASHELKTPLAVLRADVEHTMNAPHGSMEQAVALEEALQEVARMSALVESLLTLARADEGRFDILRQRVPLEPLVREVTETALILGEEAGVAVSLPRIQAVDVMGDDERLRQLFLNLVTNAIKYTPRGGSVELSLERRNGDAVFAVKDTGIGIAGADLPFIFDRFWRADRARTRGAKSGVGLGLSISQWIAQAHGGTIDVSSRLGRGSTFTVILPAAADALPTASDAIKS